jgi:hypothetical protein
MQRFNESSEIILQHITSRQSRSLFEAALEICAVILTVRL